MAGPSCAITAELKLESSTRPQATNTITEWARALLLASYYWQGVQLNSYCAVEMGILVIDSPLGTQLEKHQSVHHTTGTTPISYLQGAVLEQADQFGDMTVPSTSPLYSI